MTSSRIRELAEQHWNGQGDLVHAHHPVMPVEARVAEELLDGVLYVKSIASITAVDTGDGLVMLDTGGPFDAQHVFDVVRAWRAGAGGLGRLAGAVFSHHHIDHVFGTRLFEAEAADEGWPVPKVYGHEDMPADFRRYRRTRGWNTAINQRQFALPVASFQFPGEFRDPDVTYRTGSRSGRATSASSSTTRSARRTTRRGPGSPSGGSSTPATCSSGPSPTPATPRRSSATPASGRPRCGRWPAWAPRSC
jgi:hypothetical protein